MDLGCAGRVGGAWVLCPSVNGPEWCMGVWMVCEGCAGVWVACVCLVEWCGVCMVEVKGEGECDVSGRTSVVVHMCVRA